MRIISLEIQDILSIEKAYIEFDNSGLVLVEGYNYDTQRSNGAGKSSIFNCLSFAIYDYLPRKITASEILRRGCKSGFAEVSILCGEDKWTVRRSRPKGAVFFKNEVKQDITQSEFESFIRLTYKQFLLTIYTPQANSRELIRFLSSPDSNKKEFLLQLLNLDQFNSAKKTADDLIKNCQISLDSEDKKLSTTNSRISAYEESLIDTSLVQSQIETLKKSVSTLQNKIIEHSQVAKPDLSKFFNLESNIASKQAEMAQAKAKREVLYDQYCELKNSISGQSLDSVCKECGGSINTAAAQIAHEQHSSKVKQKMLNIKGQIDDMDVILSKEHGITDLHNKVRDKKQQESANYQEAQFQINDLKSMVKNKLFQIESAEAKLNSNLELSNKINILQNTVAKQLDSIANHKQKLSLYKTLSAMYSPTGAQAYVLDSIVDSFNEVIQKYIDILSPTTSYTLNSFKETSKGDVTAKFSETLTKSGKEVSVGSLSGGEEKGLSLCVDFALLEVLETQFGMVLNPIILDEPFDGLDMAGREIVIDLLETLARNRQIFVIDHSSITQSSFEKVLRIELRNDVSSVV
jgi:DNA repair exonuclease SbcCD ATPase subunit